MRRMIDVDLLIAEFEKVYPLATNEMGGVVNKRIYDIINSIPVVPGRCSNDDCISRSDLKDKMKKAEEQADTFEMLVEFYEQIIDNAQPVEHERTTGKWIPLYPRTVGEWEYKCSNCGHRGFMHQHNFCSDCGADMREGIIKLVVTIANFVTKLLIERIKLRTFIFVVKWAKLFRLTCFRKDVENGWMRKPNGTTRKEANKNETSNYDNGTERA